MKPDHYLYRYFKVGTNPFKTISDLCDDEIISFMKQNFPGHEWFHTYPEKRIANRREIETWLFDKFVFGRRETKNKSPLLFDPREISLFKGTRIIRR
jgi:hypothetical protein